MAGFSLTPREVKFFDYFEQGADNMVRASLKLKELVDFLLAREIAKFKLPERLEVMSEFPVSTFGKVSKKALAEMIAKKLEMEHGG